MTSTASTPQLNTAPLGLARRRRLNRVLLYLVMIILSVYFLAPLVYMFSSSLMELRQIGTMPPEWVPDPIVWANYTKALYFWNFANSFKNTIVITAFTMLGNIVSQRGGGLWLCPAPFSGPRFYLHHFAEYDDAPLCSHPGSTLHWL